MAASAPATVVLIRRRAPGPRHEGFHIPSESRGGEYVWRDCLSLTPKLLWRRGRFFYRPGGVPDGTTLIV